MKLHITGGHIIDPANGLDSVADLYIAEGKVIQIGSSPDGFTPDSVIEAKNQVVCPGLVDLRAQCREPGQEYKATIASETCAAASAGITTLCNPPDTDPIVDSAAVAALIQRRAERIGMARIVPLGALTKALNGTQLSEMSALKDAGCVGVSNDCYPVENNLIMRRALEYAATFDLTVFIRAQDHGLINNGCAHEGAVSTRLGLPGIPTAVETVAVATHLALIEQTGARAHFTLLSSERAAQMIARAQHDGLPVTADVCAHQLHLTDNDVLDFDSLCHVSPPLRNQRDRDGLRHWLAHGAITAICSDHQPHEMDAKLAPFSATATGISALETLLPLSLKMVDEGVLSLTAAISCLTCRPARILGIDAGTLSIGAQADICIFNPDEHWILNDETVQSHGHNTPFFNWEMKGRVTHTLYRGNVVYSLQNTTKQ